MAAPCGFKTFQMIHCWKVYWNIFWLVVSIKIAWHQLNFTLSLNLTCSKELRNNFSIGKISYKVWEKTRTRIQKKDIKLIHFKNLLLRFRWWLHDPGLPGWNFNLSSQDRFYPLITCGNSISSWKSRTVFHLLFD